MKKQETKKVAQMTGAHHDRVFIGYSCIPTVNAPVIPRPKKLFISHTQFANSPANLQICNDTNVWALYHRGMRCFSVVYCCARNLYDTVQVLYCTVGCNPGVCVTILNHPPTNVVLQHDWSKPPFIEHDWSMTRKTMEWITVKKSPTWGLIIFMYRLVYILIYILSKHWINISLYSITHEKKCDKYISVHVKLFM